MELNWREKIFNQNLCSGNINNESKGDLLITGNIHNGKINDKLMYWAAAPANHSASFSGSGLPYPNPEVAYDRTPNVGTVLLSENGTFAIRIKYPNSYYTTLGTGYIPPILNLKLCDGETTSIQIDDGIPFRSLTHIKKHTVDFYNTPQQNVRSQEEILRNNAYPSHNSMPSDFWGLKPPL